MLFCFDKYSLLKRIKMKKLKLITVFTLITILGLTSCQTEESTEVGIKPETSSTSSFFKRVAMNNGSTDDFLDGNAGTELLFPIRGMVNGQQITLTSKSDFLQVLNIMGALNNDKDSTVFNFPIRVRTSDYLEVILKSQSDFDALKQENKKAEEEGISAISSIDIDFPITMLTYSLGIEQTRSVLIQSKKQLYNFITCLQSDELFSVDYPMSVALSNETAIQINSEAEFINAILKSVQIEKEITKTAETAAGLEAVLTGSKFKIKSFITDKGSDYTFYGKDWLIEFTNNLKIFTYSTRPIAPNPGNHEGTYEVISDKEVFLNILFVSNDSILRAVNNKWVVTSYSNTMVALQDKTNTSNVLVFEKQEQSEREDQQLLTNALFEIDSMASSKSCNNSLAWTFTSYGSKPCGGPVGYIAYSINIDTVLFLKKIEMHRIAQKTFNEKWGIVSECSVPTEPSGVVCNKEEKPELVY